jgi:hypothetical protein
MSPDTALDLLSITRLKDGYKRRLRNLNEEIRQARKAKKETKSLTVLRKEVDRNYNLLVQLEIKYQPNDPEQYRVYHRLLNIYNHD